MYSINKELLAKEKMLTVDTANLSRKAEASITEDILFCIENLYLPVCRNKYATEKKNAFLPI